MYSNLVIGLTLWLSTTTGVFASAVLPRAVAKANEFSSGNCAQGTASFEHASGFLTDVTMDDTSHSVYFASGPWYWYSDKSEDGGVCLGDLLGRWNNDNAHPCVNLDKRNDNDNRRIACVRWGSV